MSDQTQEQDNQQQMELETGEEGKKQEQPNVNAELLKKLKEYENNNAELARKLEASEKSKLVEKENFKELWELEKGQREQWESKYSDLKNGMITDKKVSAVEKEAIRMGIHEQALRDLELLDHSELQVEATSLGRINVIGVDSYMQNLKAMRPHWFKNQAAPNVNNGGENTHAAPKELTGAEIVELQKKDPAKYKEYINKMIQKRAGR